MRNAEEMFSSGPNPTRAKHAWSSSTCLLYEPAYQNGSIDTTLHPPPAPLDSTFKVMLPIVFYVPYDTVYRMIRYTVCLFKLSYKEILAILS